MTRLIALVMLASGVFATPAYGDKVVNAPGDAGTGGCTAGECTLREAVVDTTGPGDPVIVPAGTYNLAQGPLQLAGDTIVGAGARTTTIDAGGTAKVLHATGGTNQVSGVTLRNGGGVSLIGQATAAGGAILVQSSFAPTSLTLTNVTVTGSHSTAAGGGIANLGSTVTLINSTVSNNVADDMGASTNTFGGGMVLDQGGTTTLRNTTVSNNTARSSESPSIGGGVYVGGSSQTGITRLITEGVTIAGNASPRASGLFLASTSTSGSFSHTIIANNLLLTGAPGPACEVDSSTLTSNLDIADDATCAFAGSPRDPRLGPLQNNGGQTNTHALAITSPAINAGGLCSATDQRGIPRDGACDIGAFEYFRPRLTVVKRVINDDGGSQTAGDFNVHVRAGAADVGGSPQPGTAAGRTYTLTPGTYTVAEDADSTYAASFSGGCGATGVVTLVEGRTVTCMITNNDKPPVAGELFNAEPEGGTVKVKPRGEKRFHVLREGEQLPPGSIIDTRKGRVGLIAANDTKGHEATAEFFDGIFRLGQTKGKKPITVLTLVEKLTGCKAKGTATSAARKKRRRRLWGDGHGRFRTKGKHSAATVVGTKWLVEDRCDSTLTRVKRGKVKVRDFAKHKTVIVRKGHRYIAHAG